MGDVPDCCERRGNRLFTCQYHAGWNAVLQRLDQEFRRHVTPGYTIQLVTLASVLAKISDLEVR